MTPDGTQPVESIVGADVDGLSARVAALEAREAEHQRAERVQAAPYRIAEAASGRGEPTAEPAAPRLVRFLDQGASRT